MTASCAIHVCVYLILPLYANFSVFHTITKPVYVSSLCVCPSSTSLIIGCEIIVFLHKLHNHKRKPLLHSSQNRRFGRTWSITAQTTAASCLRSGNKYHLVNSSNSAMANEYTPVSLVGKALSRMTSRFNHRALPDSVIVIEASTL